MIKDRQSMANDKGQTINGQMIKDRQSMANDKGQTISMAK